MPKHLTKRIKEEVSSESESDTENSTKLNESSDEEIELDSDESKLKMFLKECKLGLTFAMAANRSLPVKNFTSVSKFSVKASSI